MPAATSPIDPHDLTLPDLPNRLVGCRIAHLTDLHVWFASNRWTRLAHQLCGLRLDLVLFTGDYVLHRKREDLGLAALKQLTDHLRPSIGSFGVFGNHDHDAMRQFARTLPVRWLSNETATLEQLPIEIMGLDAGREPRHDAVEMMLRHEPVRDGVKRLRLCLHHFPHHLMTVADLGADVMLSGHTHGGQCRLPTGHALANNSDLPVHLSGGILRHRNTLLALSRGIGTGPLPPRLFCKPHVPVYTLRKGPMPGQFTEGIHNVKPW